MHSARASLLALVAAAPGLACAVAPGRAPERPEAAEGRFSGDAALAELHALMDLPRALGDPRRAASIDALESRLRSRGAAAVARFDHQGADPWSGEAMAMTTLVAAFRPEAPRRFILATHFDTRPWAEADPDPSRRDRPIPGANDGTSGAALLLELAPRLLGTLDPDVGFWVIFFDGEELGRPPETGYCAGSRALAEAIASGERGDLAELRGAAFAVVLDMIGDAELTIAPEARSMSFAPWLIEQVWRSAAARAPAAFVDGPIRTITDDHVALAGLGIPSILLIDSAYPPWHTHEDTIARVSAASLGAVGEVLVDALLELSTGPWPPSPRPLDPAAADGAARDRS
ncbi:MAG: M28 family peptidase [Nannocystaceae bacterium]